MKVLKAGPLRAGYENGFLRRISYQGSEVLRMIYFALRDHNWNTIALHIEDEKVVDEGDSFHITYQAANKIGNEPVIVWKAKIDGERTGEISFSIEGTVVRDFRKNRAGFCVLHPLNVLGTKCRLFQEDGSTVEKPFPVQVAADNPFTEIRSMEWYCGKDRFRLDFEGDIFETEDQRNWGDASFKTFCTPLRIPFPAELKSGDHISQRMILKPSEPLTATAADSQSVIIQSAGRTAIMPRLGTGASTQIQRLTEQHVQMLRALRLNHYRVDVFPGSDTFASDLSVACENAYELGLPLEAAVYVTSNFREEVEAFSVICQQNKVRLQSVLLLSSEGVVTPREVGELIPELRTAFPRVVFGVGTDYNFNELNKNPVESEYADFVSFSVDPQEHASDDLTILENAETIKHLIQSVRAIYGSKRVHVSPITMRRRSNPYATNHADVKLDEATKTDRRQKENLGALWTFGALASLADGGASSGTIYQTAGDQGVIGADGQPYPLYEVVKLFASFQGRPVEHLESSDALTIDAVLFDKKILAIANLSADTVEVKWEGRSFILEAGEVRTEKI